MITYLVDFYEKLMIKKYFQVSIIGIILHIALSLLLILCCRIVFGQTVVGMGTESPNSNAVLELFSDNHNQGFLVPRFTTTQRIASSFTSQLSSADNGLLIFDTDEGNFFYWYNGEWHQEYTQKDIPTNTINWYSGSSDPADTQGINGDFYFNSTTGNLYRKVNGQFLMAGNLTNNENQDLGAVLTLGNDARGKVISNLGTPLSAADAATKSYVDATQVLAQGNILIGSSNNTAQSLNAKVPGQILIGNGTTLASVKISGDLVLLADGTITLNNLSVTTSKIENDAVTKDKLNADVAGSGLGQNADGSLEINVAGGGLQLLADQLQLSNNKDGQLLIGNNNQVNPAYLSGDAILAGDGTVTTVGLQGRKVATTAPAAGEVLTWNGSQWFPSVNGASWYSGSTTPSSNNPVGATDGTFYYKTDTKIVFMMENGNWIPISKWPDQAVNTPVTFVSNDNSNPDKNLGKIGDFYIKANGVPYLKTKVDEWRWFATF